MKLFFGAQAHYETRHGVWFEKKESSYRLDVHSISKLPSLKWGLYLELDLIIAQVIHACVISHESQSFAKIA